MPSHSPKVAIAAFVTALGLAATDGGAILRDRAVELLGLPLITLSVIALLMAVTRQIAATKREIDGCREQIEGEAFAQAIELWRSGALTPSRPNSEPPKDAANTP